MGVQLFTNNADSSLNSNLAIGGTTITLVTGGGTGFPTPTAGDYFLATLFWLNGGIETDIEVVQCTTRSNDTLTVVRDFENMVGAGGYAYNTGLHTVYLSLRWTAHGATEALQKAGLAAEMATKINAATTKATPVDADEIALIDSAASNVLKKLTWANLKATLLTTWKDATDGLVGMTLFKINFKNAANTFTSFFTNTNTAARTYTFQNRDGTIADDTDLGTKAAIAGAVGQAFSAASLEVGHASDTTITRSAAGVIAVEGVVIPSISSTNTLTNKTLTGPKETVYTITDGAAFEIDPANGGMQKVTIGASRTPKGTNFATSQSMTLKIADGTAYAITWTDVTLSPVWVGGSAPTLATTGWTVIELWKDGDALYASHVGNVA